MSYNTDGASFGGFPMPFPVPCFGSSNNNDGMNGPFGLLMAILFFALFGWGGGMGGMMPGRGMPMPMGGMMPCGGAAMAAAGGNIAAETAAFVGAQNTADRVSSIATGVDAVAGIATANGVKIETVKDQNNAGFANLNTHLCEGFHSVSQQFSAQTMQGMNLHNSLTALLNDMRAENAKCCCETKSMTQAIASQQQYQAESNKSELLRAIDALGCRLDSRIDGLERAALQDKLAAATAQAAELKAKLDNQNQTGQIAGMIQAALASQQPRGCGCPSTPCGCQNPICTVLDSWVTRWANAQNIPAAQPTT